MTKFRKIVSSSITIVTMLSLVITIMPIIQFAAAQSTAIQIDSDGAINSSSSDVPLQRDGDNYRLTGDSGPIFVKKSNIIIDGMGYTIERRNANDVYGGIVLSEVQNVTIKNFSIKSTSFGVSMRYCSNITIANNTISGVWHPIPMAQLPAAIKIDSSNYNTITDNRLEDNNVGMLLWGDSKGNLIVGNSILRSVLDGIRLYEASGNTFYHNNFDNSKNVDDIGWDSGRGARSVNIWDNSEEGNFWSNYNGSDANGDGIGDTGYQINLQNVDDFPLMEPFNRTYYLLKTTPPKISLVSPISQVYNQTDVPLTFIVDKTINWVGYSVNNGANITINGNLTSIQLPQGTHNLTIYATDDFGNTGASKAVTFTVNAETVTFSPALAVSIFAVSAGAVVCFIVLLYLRKRRNQKP